MNGIESEISMSESVAGIISEYTGIDKNKVQHFIEQAGLKAILHNPSLICVDEAQQELLHELRELLERTVKANESVPGR